MEWILQVHCGQLHEMSAKTFQKLNDNNPLHLMAYTDRTKFIVPGYMYKDAIFDLYDIVVEKANKKFGEDRFWKKCIEYNILNDCRSTLQVEFEPEYAVKITQHKEFMRDVLADLWKYYDDNDLCVKVLFVG